MIYFISDLHLCHDKDFLYKPRGFNSVEEMNAAILNNWNKTVSETDTVYILGDIMLNDNKTASEIFRQLKGEIHIIRGNHDTDARIALYKTFPNVKEVVDAKFLKIGKTLLFLSHYPSLTSNPGDFHPTINLCGHTHTSKWDSDMNKGLIYHVDADAHHCTPISFEKIREDIRFYTKTN